MFSVEMLRTSTPPEGDAPPLMALAPPDTVGFMAERFELFDIGAPSRIIAVPSAFKASS